VAISQLFTSNLFRPLKETRVAVNKSDSIFPLDGPVAGGEYPGEGLPSCRVRLRIKKAQRERCAL
jgi:hypothetical protein